MARAGWRAHGTAGRRAGDAWGRGHRSCAARGAARWATSLDVNGPGRWPRRLARGRRAASGKGLAPHRAQPTRARLYAVALWWGETASGGPAQQDGRGQFLVVRLRAVQGGGPDPGAPVACLEGQRCGLRRRERTGRPLQRGTTRVPESLRGHLSHRTGSRVRGHPVRGDRATGNLLHHPTRHHHEKVRYAVLRRWDARPLHRRGARMTGDLARLAWSFKGGDFVYRKNVHYYQTTS